MGETCWRSPADCGTAAVRAGGSTTDSPASRPRSPDPVASGAGAGAGNGALGTAATGRFIGTCGCAGPIQPSTTAMAMPQKSVNPRAAATTEAVTAGWERRVSNAGGMPG